MGSHYQAMTMMIKLLECVISGFSICLDISAHKHTFDDLSAFLRRIVSINQSTNQSLLLLILGRTRLSCPGKKQLNSKSVCAVCKCLPLCVWACVHSWEYLAFYSSKLLLILFLLCP